MDVRKKVVLTLSILLLSSFSSLVLADSEDNIECIILTDWDFDYELIEFLSSLSIQKVDFSKDIIPKLLGRIQTYHTSDFFIDIGTKESLEEANKFWEEINE